MLDLSRRNRLLKYRETARDIAAIDEMPNQVFGHLMDGKRFEFLAHPELEEGEEAPSRLLPSPKRGATEASPEHSDNKLQTPFIERELERRLKRLYSAHRTAIEETGANALYVALGFLRWYEREDSDVPLRSPLVLLPVVMTKRRGFGSTVYELEFDDQALDTNYSLAEKLARDFDIALPTFGEKVKPESYWRKVAQAVQSPHRATWGVEREIAVGLFRFHKQVLWHDLDPARWPKDASLVEHPLLGRIFLGPTSKDPSPGPLIGDYDIDAIEDGDAAPTLVLDADSSQISAIVDALDRQDGLVIEGPPGTGKSQTIANLIAAALGRGESVLFVAEKMAALDVVYKRLTDVGLGDFCFQMHGLKANRTELLQSVDARLKKRFQKARAIEAERGRLGDARRELLHLSKVARTPVGPESKPLHEVLWRIERLRQQLGPNFRCIPLEGIDRLTADSLRRGCQLLDSLGSEWSGINENAVRAWAGFEPAAAQTLTSEAAPITRGLAFVDEALAQLRRGDLSGAGVESVARLVKLGKNDTIPIPGPPPRADPKLFSFIVNQQRIDALAEFVGLVKRYLDQVSKVRLVFDYEAELAPTYATKLEEYGRPLVELDAWASCPIERLRSEASELEEIVEILDGLSPVAEPVLALTGGHARTLAEYQSLAAKAEELMQGPRELSLHGDPRLARRAAENHLEEALATFNRLLSFGEDDLRVFRLEDIREPAEVQDAITLVRDRSNAVFPILRRDYREARRLVRRLMSSPASFSRKAQFLNLLSLLSRYCSNQAAFEVNEIYRAGLGVLFKGMQTDWQTARSLVDHAQELVKVVGRESTQRILADWDDHLDTMSAASESLERQLKTVATYREARESSSPLWDRPVGEVVAELGGRLNHLNRAVEELLQPWINTTASVHSALEASADYERGRRIETEIERAECTAGLIGEHWNGPRTSLVPLESTLAWTRGCLAVDGVDQRLLQWMTLSDAGLDEARLRELSALAHSFRAHLSTHSSQLQVEGNVQLAKWCGGSNATLDDFRAKLSACLSTVSYLPVLSRWWGLKRQVDEHGLASFSEALVGRHTAPDLLSAAFQLSVYEPLARACLAGHPEVSALGLTQLDGVRAQFAQLDLKVLGLNAKALASELGENVPAPGVGHGKVGSYSGVALLRHEIRKKRRHIPMRQLVNRAGDALQTLKPCFLMSPMSVAQYIAPGAMEFDLVIMDEASQIRPEEALGAIARSKRAVIVGDPKQLPPTRFFDAVVSEDEEAEETVLDDTESILDVCRKQLPFRRLKWHYRSQHESLIHFSNDRFYDGDLVIFPSPRPDAEDMGIKFHQIEFPSYRKGRNPGEADAVVERIVQHIQTEPNRSLGVAAFSKRQADEIDLRLDRIRRQRPEIDELFANANASEPLFIKNLENVQGDERDVVFISTTYGPESAGAHVFQRFGPINSELGWRRLNVIITRARQRVEVFSSLHPSDILISTGTRRGVRTLRDYIEYASTGVLPEPIDPKPPGEPDSEFEQAVADMLSSMGYEVVPQVGVAGFFIDIGVLSPVRSGDFLLGIECDGAAYHSSSSVRDRDRLRQEILESKGWQIHRIWSTNWFHARQAEIDRLKRVLDEAVAASRVRPVEVFVKPPVGEVTEPAVVDKAMEEDRDLEEVLERYWESNIRPDFPDRTRSILTREIIPILTRTQPWTESEWQQCVPFRLRERIDPKQGQYLEDILGVIGGV